MASIRSLGHTKRLRHRLRLGSAVGGAVAPVFGPQPLRVVASGGQVNTVSATTTGTKTRCKGRKRARLGPSPVRRVKVGFSNWHLVNVNSALAETSGATQVDVDNVYIEYNGVAVRATKDGSTTISVPAGQDLLLTDDVLPSQFGLPTFPAGAVLWIRYSYTLAAGSGASAYASNMMATGECRYQWDAAANPGFDDANGSGVMVAPTGTNASAAFGPVGLFGEFDRPTVVMYGLGDSLFDNSNDLAGDGEAGGQVFRRACWAAGLSYFNCSIAGGRSQYFNAASAKRAALYPYVTHAIDEPGTNDLAGGISNSTLLVTQRLIWAQMKAAGIQKVYRTTIYPKVTSTDGNTTLANQTVFSAAFGAGGARDLIHGQYAGEVTAGRIDGIVDLAAVVADPSDSHLWKPTGHVTTLAASSLAGATTISTVADVPGNQQIAVIEGGVVDSATSNILPGQTTGTGPFSLKLSAGLTAAHAAGSEVRSTPAKDGTHAGPQRNIELADVLAPVLQSFSAAA